MTGRRPRVIALNQHFTDTDSDMTDADNTNPRATDNSVMPSGTAPIPHRLHQFLRDVLHKPVRHSPRRYWVLIVAALFLVMPFISHLHKAFRQPRPHGDWVSIYNIAAYSLESGRLDAPVDPTIVRSQRYPPITRPLLMLFAIPPKAVSAVLAFVLFAALYVWSAGQVARLFGEPAPAKVRVAGVLALGLVAPYVWADLTAGNLTSVLLASLTGAFVLNRRGRPFLAGIALSIGTLLKIIPVLCLLFFLVRRRWAAVWGTMAGLILIGLIPSLLLFGPRQVWDYHHTWYRTQFLEFTPMHTIDVPTECSYQNQAVVRTLVRLFRPVRAGSADHPFRITVFELPPTAVKILYALIMALSAAALLGFLWRTRSADSPAAESGIYAVCVGSMLWFSPWVGSYYFSLAIWPAAAVLGLLLRHPPYASQVRWPRRALLFWLLAMFAIASLFLRSLSIHTLAAELLTFTLARFIRDNKTDMKSGVLLDNT